VPLNLVNGVDLARFGTVRWPYRGITHVLITLNGERYELERPMTMLDLLARLDIDPRRVAIEHNLEIIRRRTFESAVIREGDRVEIVNAVGGG
jgi:thiamine biosynthesis protein ThiS